jgi:predicted lipoprotein with Yx(FWY)xxD motif
VAGLAAVAAAGLVAGCSSGSSPTSAGSGNSGQSQGAAVGVTISTRSVSGVGTVLTDKSGKTLYSPRQEASGAIKCTGSCLGFWFPLTVASGVTPQAGSGVAGTLGSIQRPDGTRQLTYNSAPLYTFRLDTAPGQAHGNNFSYSFNGQSFTWEAETTGAKAPAPASTPSQPGNSGYNYGGGGGY